MLKWLFWGWVCWASNVAAAPLPTLTIGVDNFAPPFVNRGAHDVWYGFDVTMMNYICTQIKRTCVFKPYYFRELLPAVANGEIEVGVGAIAITPERLTRVNFTQPYVASKASFLTLNRQTTVPFTFSSLNRQRIGIEKGSIYPQVIRALGIVEPRILAYDSNDLLVDALQQNQIDYALLDTPEAKFWQSKATSHLRVIGPSFKYGVGLGIAVNQANKRLLADINRALAQFLQSPAFRQAQTQFLNYF